MPTRRPIGLAQAQRDMGDYAAAEASARDGLGISEELGRRVTWSLIGLGDVLKEQGRLDDAASTYCVQKRLFLAAVPVELIDRQPGVTAHVRSRRVDRLWSALRLELPPDEPMRAAKIAQATELESALVRLEADAPDAS